MRVEVNDQDCPVWSVMIPSYNCARYLRETLVSVLQENVPSNLMQIAVVDDGSEDDPEAIVGEVGSGRVEFVSSPGNRGAVATFNRCIELARGDFVHILHGDDFVSNGFYEKVGVAFSHGHPAMVTTRCYIVDASSDLVSLSPRVTAFGSDTLHSLYEDNAICTPGVVVRRSAYEACGGFDSRFVHAADWEMWVRVARWGGGVAVNEPLACYRVHADNDTTRLVRSGERIRDLMRLADHWAATDSTFDRRAFMRKVRRIAWNEAARFSRLGDIDASSANMSAWRSATPGFGGRVWRLGEFLTRVGRGIQSRVG